MKIKKKHVDLSAISYYLKCGQYPDGLTDSDKRGVRKRSKDFRLKDEELYFVRDPRSGDSSEEESDSEKKNNPSYSVTVWRKVLHEPDVIRKAFLECHVDEEGNHRSYDKTLKEFTEIYYLSKTIETVRTYIKECPYCQAYRHGTPVQSTPAGKTPSEREEHVAELMAALPFTEIIGDVITRFWQKVEVDLFGPYKVMGGHLAYVAVCLDSFSLWPEAKILEYQEDVIPVADILQFILSLIARYGIMNTLMFRKESLSRKDINGRFDLLTDEENPIDLEFGGSGETDPIWKDLECDFGKFAKNYPRDWSKCIDLCLMPHRISRPEIAEYTPAYLVHNREPRLPTSISHRQPNSDLDPNLNEAQMRSTQTRLMKASKALSDIFVSGSPEKSTTNSPDLPILYYSMDEVGKSEPATTPLSTPVMKNLNGKLNHSSMEVDVPTPATPPAPPANKKGVVVSTPISTRSKKSTPVTEGKPTRGRGRPPKSARLNQKPEKQENNATETETEGLETENDDFDGQSESESTPGRRGQKTNYSDVVNRYSPKKGNNRKRGENRDVPLDDYYSALKLYVQHKRYPAGINDDYKRVIRKMATNYVLDKDILYYKSGSKLKKTVMDELERFKLLKEAHVLENGTHLGRFRTLARLNDYYWKAMTVDALALVKTCPVCEHGNEKRKSDTDHNPAQESFLNLIKMAESEAPALKEETQIRRYACLKQYLVGGNKKTDKMTAEEIEFIEKESANYKVSADGHLFYIEHKGIDGLRKVITTNAERQKILTDIHILRTGIHRGVERTKAILQGNYYWIGMNRDLKEFLEKCCLTRVFPEDKNKKSQEDKLAKFAEYFLMDMNLLTAKEVRVNEPEPEPSNDKEPEENILTSVGLKEKIPSADQKAGLLKTADSQGNDDAMEEALVEAAQAAEANRATSTNILETADITDPITTTTTTTTTTTVESATNTSTNTTITLIDVPTTITSSVTITDFGEVPTTDSTIAVTSSESPTLALTDSKPIDSNVDNAASESVTSEENPLPSSDKVVKTYSEVACNTEDSDVTDDMDDSDGEGMVEEVIVSPKDLANANVIVVEPSSLKQTLEKAAKKNPRLYGRQLNDSLKKNAQNAVNDMDEVQSAVNNLKSEAEDIDEMPDDVAALTSMIQRRQNAAVGDLVETPVTTIRAASSSVIRGIKRDLDEMEDGELEEGEIIKEECMSLNSPIVEYVEPIKGGKKIKAKRGKRKKQLACSICGSLFGGPVALQIHMSAHSGQKPFGCEICGKRFTERKYVRIHMRRHTGEKPYLCSICGKGFPRTQSLQSHMMVHEKGAETPQKCEVCNRPFASENRLRAHMEAKHPAVPKVYKCAECNRVFTAMRSLKRHIEAHMGLKRYECQHCGRRFLRKEYLRSHAQQHTGDVSPVPKRKKTPLPCPQLKITVGSNTYSVFTSDASAVTPEQQETWVAAELMQNEEQIQDPNETVRATESVEQSVEAPLFFIAPNQVEYEVECTSSGGTELTEADLTAINILAQATLNTPTALPLT